MSEKEQQGDGLYIDVDHMEPSNSDEEIWNSANMLVSEVGYTFQEIVDHLGIPAEKIREVIRKKMAQRSDNIKKSFDAGDITSDEFENAIEEIQAFSKTIGKV